jgi:2-polyprenyl-3-methyl-5-hydroxy-6-metoxy-1,4-benzoquinol methylase
MPNSQSIAVDDVLEQTRREATNGIELPGFVDSADAATVRTYRIWSAGDYDRIAAGFRDAAAAFVERQALRPGTRVLDAACGSGNLTIPAARSGAAVTGLDIVPELLARTATWAARESLTVRVDEGSVEALPYADASFDVVLSMFGVMFAARPDRVVAELARVTRPGGRVVLANWTPGGFVGRMFAIHARHVPPAPGAPSPLLWGDDSAIRQRFGWRDWDVSTTTRTLTFSFPSDPAGTAAVFRSAYGPTIRAMEVMDDDARRSFTTELGEHWLLHNSPATAATRVESEYLEITAVRR